MDVVPPKIAVKNGVRTSKIKGPDPVFFMGESRQFVPQHLFRLLVNALVASPVHLSFVDAHVEVEVAAIDAATRRQHRQTEVQREIDHQAVLLDLRPDWSYRFPAVEHGADEYPSFGQKDVQQFLPLIEAAMLTLRMSEAQKPAIQTHAPVSGKRHECSPTLRIC